MKTLKKDAKEIEQKMSELEQEAEEYKSLIGIISGFMFGISKDAEKKIKKGIDKIEDDMKETIEKLKRNA